MWPHELAPPVNKIMTDPTFLNSTFLPSVLHLHRYLGFENIQGFSLHCFLAHGIPKTRNPLRVEILHLSIAF